MKLPAQFGFYSVLTNPLRGYEYLTELLVDYGIAFVQLRIKEGSADQILRTASRMREITQGTATKLIINDFPDIALKVSADGTHIGQDDLAIEELRPLMDNGHIIGLSTHSPAQTIDACARKPDYIGVGPVYKTPTKKNADPVIGIDGMKEMLAVATVPAVVIGGIDFSNIRDVLDSGAKNFCMVRQLTSSEDPQEILKKTINIYNEYFPGFYKV
jgi:thiamine-phosphate pyrophosphorylase